MPQKDGHESRNIKDADKVLQAAYPKILEYYEAKNPGLTLNLSCVYRTPERQFDLYRQGRSNHGTLDHPNWKVTEPTKIVTNCDGYDKVSKHNAYPSKALDFFVVDKKTKKALWLKEFYKDIGVIAKKLGLIWGGDWAMDDYPHVEIGKDSFGALSSKHIHGFLPTRLQETQEPDDADPIV
jgi:hypothetical protein